MQVMLLPMAYLDVRQNSGSTSYRIKYRIDGRERVLTCKDKATADYWLPIFNAAGPLKALQLIETERAAFDNIPTVRQVVEDHIRDLTGVTDGTRDEYRNRAAGAIYPHLGDLPITALPAALPGWINTLSKTINPRSKRPLTGKTIVNIHSLLSGAATSAVNAGWLDDNPCRGMRLPRTMQQEMTFLTRPQFKALLARIDDYWQPLTTTLAGTGLRWGEATALHVGDVDLDAGTIHVRRAWKHRRKELGPPKSKAGRRTVHFGPVVAAALKPLLDGRSSTAFVFTTRAGTPIPANSYHGHVWGPAVKAAVAAGELPRPPRVHDLRHTYASWALAANVPMIAVQRAMGHEKIATTVDLYGHLAPEALAQVAAAVDAALAED